MSFDTPHSTICRRFFSGAKPGLFLIFPTTFQISFKSKRKRRLRMQNPSPSAINPVHVTDAWLFRPLKSLNHAEKRTYFHNLGLILLAVFLLTAVWTTVAMADPSLLRITELHYNPSEPTPAEAAAGFSDAQRFEFIEIKNTSNAIVNLSGVAFTLGISFTFGDTQLAPGAHTIIASDQAAFTFRYGAGIDVSGEYTDNLSNVGERIVLADASAVTILDFAYDDASPWPLTPNGQGPSLEVIDTGGSYNDAGNWKASAQNGGSPGVFSEIDRPVTIMPLGDSITFDPVGGTGYRRYLWHLLMDSGYNVDFVGSVRAGQNVLPLFDPDNEGHSGWTAAQIASNVNTFLQNNPADIVLLHIGTNGLSTDPDNVEEILNNIDLFETSSGREVLVLLARILNRSCMTDTPACTESATTSTFNHELAVMAQNRIAGGDNIIMVDMENSAGMDYRLEPAGDMYDNLHPGEGGDAKMADVWFDALQTVLPAPEVLPHIQITSPASGSMLAAPFDVTFAYANWTVAPGLNHIRLLVDGQDRGGHYAAGPISVSSLTAGTHVLSLVLANADGSLTNFFDGIEVSTSPTGAIPQSGWRLVYADSQELVGEDGAATNAFDNDINTIWHTQWSSSNPSHPHEIQIDLGADYLVDGFRYLPRQDGTPNGRIGRYAFFVSDSTVQWGAAVADGTLANTGTEQEIRFSPKAGRYIRLVALSDANGFPWTSAAEINVLGSPLLGGETPVLSSIVVTPDRASLRVGDIYHFDATGIDQYGNPIAVAFSWSINAGGIIDDQGQLAVTSVGGPFTITARSGNVVGTAEVLVSTFPGLDWQTAAAESQGVDPDALTAALNYYENNAGGVGGDEMVIVRNGYVIWQGSNTDAFHSIQSGTKVFTTTVLGLLIDDETIPSVNSKPVDYLPSLDDTYPSYGEMTLKQMASFTSGYTADTTPTPDMVWGDATRFLDPIAPVAEPGTRWEYSDPTACQLGNILTIASGDTLENIFQTRIADAIGMHNWEWRHYALADDGRGQDIVAYFQNPAGIYGGGIAATPLDIARFGLLYLNRGKWDGQQLLSSAWVDEATTNQVDVSLDVGPALDLRGIFGYMWWTNGLDVNGNRPWPSAPPRTYTFNGGFRNFCIVIPEWNMVIVRMSPADQSAQLHETVWEGFFSLLAGGIASP
jgi:CubicO group peptidase (beta-lactamase class C family)